jgi:hypothetical protein
VTQTTQERRHWYSRITVWVMVLAGVVVVAVLIAALLVAGQDGDEADLATNGEQPTSQEAEQPSQQDVLTEANPALAALLGGVPYVVYEGVEESVASDVVSLDEFDAQRSFLIDPDGDDGDLLVFVPDFALVSDEYQTWIAALPPDADLVDLEPYLDEQ